MVQFVITGKLPSLNDYLNSCKHSKRLGAAMKREIDSLIGWQLKGLPPLGGLQSYHFEWHEPNMKRDPDNVDSARKFIFDALQHCGLIPNDGQKNIGPLSSCIVVNRGCEHHVVVTVTPADAGDA